MINVHSLWVKDGLLTYGCLSFYIKTANQPSVPASTLEHSCAFVYVLCSEAIGPAQIEGGAELRPAEERWVAEEKNVLPEQPAIPFKV